MKLKLFVILTLAVLGLTSLVVAEEEFSDDNELIDLDGDDVRNSPLLLRRRELAASWWERIKSSYPGKDLKQCARKRNIPKTGDKCGKDAKTCFFGTQDCPSVGSHPTSKCTCNGTKSSKGKWTCVPEPCPAGESTTPALDEVAAPALKAGFYLSPRFQPFEVKLNLLTPKVLEGYDNITEIKDDLTQAVRFYVNSVIEEQSKYDFYAFEFRPIAMEPPSMVAANSPPKVSSPSAAGATDFSTNNQEEGVDESDLVKSDGVYSYAAYGDIVVIWNAATGEFVANYTLPPINDKPQTAPPSAPPVAFTKPPPLPLDDSNLTEPVFISDAEPMAAFMRPIFFFEPKPVIQGMSLAADRLVLYVQGYGEKIRSARNYASPFSNAYDTRVVILDTSTLPASIDVVSQDDIQGSFRDARSIGSDIHVVTTSYIDYYPVTGLLYRWNAEYQGLNSTDYKAKAVSIAEPLIDDYVATLLSEILIDGKAPSIPKISIWQSDLGNNTNIVQQLYGGGAIQAYVQLTSFSVQGLTGNATLSTAGAFTPSSWGYTYAVGGDLVFAAQGWNWSPWWQGSSQTTYLMGFKLNGASATPSYLGSVDGYILNQYSLSVFEGHLRVAATVDTFWPVWEPVLDSSNFTIPPQPVSRTNNTVHVLKIPTGNETVLKPVTGIPNLGKPDERFTAVRYFGNICYVVTFLQKDPFYVLDLNPVGAKILGELEISGFSSYIQSINAANTLLVTVGQEADAEGRILGVKISLFDAANATSPVELQKFVAEQDPLVYSSSSVQWDFKAFRWLALGDGVGILIMPLQIYSYNGGLTGNFDGFVAYDVSASGISERLNISHVDSEQFYGCYYQAYLPERSFVFNGNVTTMKGHSVVSTDLDTSEKRWTLDMPKPETKNDCVFWLY